MKIYKVEVKNRTTGDWEVREEVEAKSRRAYLHSHAKDAKSRHYQLLLERIQWRCCEVA